MIPDFEKILEKPRRSKPMLTDELRTLMNLPAAPSASPMLSDRLPLEQRPMLNAVPYSLPEMPDFAGMQEQQRRQALMQRNMAIIKALLQGETPQATARPAVLPGGIGSGDQVLPDEYGGYQTIPEPEFGWNQNNMMNLFMRMLDNQFPGGNWR